LKGFSWRPGRLATTRGVLFWNDVFLDDAGNGEKLAIIVMDTQGLFEIGTTTQSDARIFGLSTMLSSIQVLNLMNTVQEDHIQHLDMVTDFTKLVNKRQKKLKVKASSKPFQNLLFLIRDWTDEDVDFGYEGGRDEIARIFTVVSSNEAAQKVRNNIYNSYDKLSCFLLPHPGNHVTRKQFTGAWKSIDSIFMEHLKVLIESLLSPQNVVKKKIFDKEVTASEFMSYVYSFFDSFRASNLPQIDSLYTSIAEKEMIKMILELENFYQEKMLNRTQYDHSNFIETLSDDHELVKALTLTKFRNTPKMGDDEMENLFAEALEVELNKSFKNLKESVIRYYVKYQNERISRQEAERAVEKEIRMRNEREKAERAEKEKRAYSDGQKNTKRDPTWKAGHYLCKIFTLGINRCGN
jgi:atlastin